MISYIVTHITTVTIVKYKEDLAFKTDALYLIGQLPLTDATKQANLPHQKRSMYAQDSYSIILLQSSFVLTKSNTA